MSSAKGLFLDLDGTLADSLGVMRQVYFRVLAGQGAQGSDAEFDALNGPPLSEVARRLIVAHRLGVDLAALLDLYRQEVVAVYDHVTPMPGAIDLIARARARGYRLGIVTSNAAALARRWADRVGIAADVIIGSDDVGRGKPDPEPYARAAERSGCDPARSVAVEDSAPGARAARDAGLICHGLRHGDAPVDWPEGVREITALDQVTLP